MPRLKQDPIASKATVVTVSSEATLWQTAEARRTNIHAVEDKHVVCGLIFPKDIAGGCAPATAKFYANFISLACASLTATETFLLLAVHTPALANPPFPLGVQP